uniref:Glycoside hydrolase 35 catalytic domain-containing protein n=1 Tax=Timema poppense TaxID=170557 RepID=A0A7R9HH60_TIMPO|nr:unnamed protein product [Timema poppensis]
METILRFPANINLYVFHGGTSFGFMNSATHQHVFPTYLSDVSSYDYDAPLSEAGDYTEKYNSTMELVSRYAPIKFQSPDLPAQSIKEAYPTTPISAQLTFEQIIDQVPSADRVTSTGLEVMERLDINNRSGQSYGFILYRKSGLTISSGTVLRISGKIRDYAIVLVDGVRKTPVFRSQEQQKTFGYFDAPRCAILVGGTRF